MEDYLAHRRKQIGQDAAQPVPPPGFIPLLPAPNGKAAPAAKNGAPGKNGHSAKGHSHSPDLPPENPFHVEVIREHGEVARIIVTCSCGHSLTLNCLP